MMKEEEGQGGQRDAMIPNLHTSLLLLYYYSRSLCRSVELGCRSGVGGMEGSYKEGVITEIERKKKKIVLCHRLLL